MKKKPIIKDMKIICYINIPDVMGLEELPNGDYQVFFTEAI